MITITPDDRAVRSFLSALMQRVDDPSPALRAIGAGMVATTQLRFRDGRAPDGSKWSPLSAVTIARRRGGSSQPLLDTGRLRNSITYVVQRNSVVVGTNVRYGAMQHFGARQGQFGRMRNGAPIPWGNVPGRPYLGISREDSRGITMILRQFLARAAA